MLEDGLMALTLSTRNKSYLIVILMVHKVEGLCSGRTDESGRTLYDCF